MIQNSIKNKQKKRNKTQNKNQKKKKQKLASYHKFKTRLFDILIDFLILMAVIINCMAH